MQADLKGITVVSVEQAVAAPYASGRLADAGARVIKIERPEGDFARRYDRLVRGESAYFVWLNRGKQSVCLDLRAPGDREFLSKLIGGADVFIQNLRPGSLAKLGLDAAELREQHPRLITCEITGFGRQGPRAHLKAYDLIVQGEVGLCSITGNGHGAARVGVSVCDIAAGMTAHAAILQALFCRQLTGRGRGIQVSLFDSIADWMNVPLLQFLYGGHSSGRSGVSHPSIAPYGAFQCSDGTSVIFSVQNEREWAVFCNRFLQQSHLEADPRFHDNSARVAHRAELDDIVSTVFARSNAPEVFERLEACGIAYGRLNELAEAATHPHLRFLNIDTPSGDVRIIAPAAIVNGNSPGLGPVPSLGQHTELVRKEYER